ncbi:MAG TPA: hypothetical protein VGM98_16605 [Schlesneria sp.]
MSYRSCLRAIGLVLLCGGLNCFLAGQAFAQVSQGPRQQIRQSFRDRPTVSPYTSLLNNGGGGGPALNYYNIVRPRQQASRVARSLSNELKSVESNVKSLEQREPQMIGPSEVISTGRMAPTGHPTAFNSLGSYFPGAPQSR